MNGINKIARDSIFLRFAANDNTQPPETKDVHSSSILWGVVAILSLLLGYGLNSEPNLNAKEMATPILPLAYISKENTFNLDFTKPLPGLNLALNKADHSCALPLEIPPTLSETLKPCITNIEKTFIQFSKNKYTIIQNH